MRKYASNHKESMRSQMTQYNDEDEVKTGSVINLNTQPLSSEESLNNYKDLFVRLKPQAKHLYGNKVDNSRINEMFKK